MAARVIFVHGVDVLPQERDVLEKVFQEELLGSLYRGIPLRRVGGSSIPSKRAIEDVWDIFGGPTCLEYDCLPTPLKKVYGVLPMMHQGNEFGRLGNLYARAMVRA